MYVIPHLFSYFLLTDIRTHAHSHTYRETHPDNTLMATHISECRSDISTWTTAHHLKLNPNETELLLMPGKDRPHMDLLVTVEKITVSPSPTARNLSVVFWTISCDAPRASQL